MKLVTCILLLLTFCLIVTIGMNPSFAGPTCKGSVGTNADLLATLPQNTLGKCYQINGKIIQFLSQRSALIALSDAILPTKVIFVIGPKDSNLTRAGNRTGYSVTGFVKGIGIFKYRAQDGSYHTVPKMKLAFHLQLL